LGAWALAAGASSGGSRPGTVALARSPALLERRRAELHRDLGGLEDAHDLQRGVFEVSAELVGCVEEGDARVRFAAAMRRYWSFASADLLVWSRGAWRSLGGEATGEPPGLAAPVALPAVRGGDLELDLSPAVDGRAALVLRGVNPQPSLAGRLERDQRWVAEVLRGQLSLSLRRVILYAELQALARVDPLTGAHRRWYGEERLRELVTTGEVVSVAMIDIDHFKRVNDGHGHAAGDQVLAAVGGLLVRLLRAGDLVCRWGGEEFLAVLPETSPAGAQLAAERIRAAVAALSDLPVAVTVSVGAASCLHDEDPLALVERADQALYRAKAGGRNRVDCAPETAEVRTSRRRRNHTSTVLKPVGRG
ncbi:MAG: GGDEF domain-containing protein, partial [Planctomycetes bacterium]|nr:GGDEF domain-containing protein [Planctomycetota bacterium]